MRNIVSCSFGKDSLAAAVVAREQGLEVSAVYCHVLFSEGLSAEMPEHVQFIFQEAIPKLERVYGIQTEVITAETTVLEYFYRTRKRGKNAGKIYGWPCFSGCWVSSNIKLPALRKWRKAQGPYVEILGICADETDRTDRDIMTGKRLILAELGITERRAAEICKEAGLLSPLYSMARQRSGCWFCPCQRTGQMHSLRAEHPDLWAIMRELDRDSPFSFKPKGTVEQYEARFAREDADREFWGRD